MNVPFLPGSQRINNHFEKSYHPYLYRFGQRRYAGGGRVKFRTATMAQDYAGRWSERAERFLAMKESNHVD